MGIQALFCLARTQDPAPDKALQSLSVCPGTSRGELQGCHRVSQHPRLLQALARGGFARVLQGIKGFGVPAWPLQGNKSLLCVGQAGHAERLNLHGEVWSSNPGERDWKRWDGIGVSSPGKGLGQESHQGEVEGSTGMAPALLQRAQGCVGTHTRQIFR